jgi:hypothetical protein
MEPTESRLETWVKVGNLVQVAVVVVGVGFTLWDFVLKDRDLIRLQRETAIRLVLDEKLKEKDSAAYYYLSQYLQCKSPDVDSSFKWDCSRFSKPPEGLSDWRAMERITRPIYMRLSRIAVCIKAKLCDADITQNLVCPEVGLFRDVTARLYSETKVAVGVGLPLSELMKTCQANRGNLMW